VTRAPQDTSNNNAARIADAYDRACALLHRRADLPTAVETAFMAFHVLAALLHTCDKAPAADNKRRTGGRSRNGEQSGVVERILNAPSVSRTSADDYQQLLTALTPRSVFSLR
jgi:hypothetical protein